MTASGGSASTATHSLLVEAHGRGARWPGQTAHRTDRFVGQARSEPEIEVHMRTALIRRLRRDEGMATAEYAMVTVAAAGLGGMLIKLFTSEAVRDFLWGLVTNAISAWF